MKPRGGSLLIDITQDATLERAFEAEHARRETGPRGSNARLAEPL